MNEPQKTRFKASPVQFTKAELEYLVREADAHIRGDIYRLVRRTDPVVGVRAKALAALTEVPHA